ncbi:Surp module [Xylona heveae TC161]|uniref:Surp module n=1 Tax=Xylona heveae (strain CBS 132557 / TC161) TaxID=1328760 RepID=A0A165AI43_XYLHT|nr:Surp module [Xylona heveae TC161]KZF20514.1 Surp module [Xylona heveae TC161]
MAPSAVQNDAETPGMEGIGKPPAGIVLPPKDIRAILEKTAGYVARNGSVFEDRIREKERTNPKFSFLSIDDAYHPFYAWRLSEIREGRGTAVSAGRANESAAAAEPEKPKGPAEPPQFHFSARMPNINAQDLDVVRLTALFVAKNGRSFMTALSQRETGNYQFEFLRPQHTLYQFFSRLVDQYTELSRTGGLEEGNVERARIFELQKNVDNKYHVLERAKQRAEWTKYQAEQKQKKEEEAEEERLAYLQIDWRDFVVVETVLFNEADDQTDLPAPTSLSDLQSASLEQKAMMSLQPHNMRIEEAMPNDEEIYYNPYESQQPVQAMPPAVPSPHPIPASSNTSNFGFQRPISVQEEEEAQRIRERAEARDRAQQAQAAAKGGVAPMRIRNDYVPRAQAKRQAASMALCPNCKQQIPYDELEQHMRIELLDPRWKEQRDKAESRFAATNLSTSDVANNLKRLASQRSDVFDGATGQPISEEEAARRKKAATNYDGQPESKDAARLQQMQSMNIEEQIRQIHQKFRQ